MNKKLFLIAHNIRSAYNVGSFFRTADGLGVEKIFLTGYTPIPPVEDETKNKKSNRQIRKTALGADQFVAWEKEEDIFKIIDQLKKNKVQIVALEQDKKSQDIKNFEPQFPCALILGNEVSGVEKEVLAVCDAIVEIPMSGKKESLNVAVATGIAIYEISTKPC